MKRTYNTGESSGVNFFIGEEVESTPAKGMKTLFVVGLHNPEQIINLAHSNNCTHIYFGANQSYDGTNLLTWTAVINECMKKNYLCTLDFDVSHIIDIHESGLCENNLFIPQISVKIPHIKLLNYNATIKIDDTDFNKSNPGVWCHSVHDLMDRNQFTDWQQYTSDHIIDNINPPTEQTNDSE